MSLALGVQTVRRGRTGPVGSLFGDMTLTGCFLFSLIRLAESLYLSLRYCNFISPPFCHRFLMFVN